MAMESILRMAELFLPRSRCQAADAPTIKAVARNATIAICARRYGNERLKMIANQSTGTTIQSMISWPCGACIQLLDARIQKVESSAPCATLTVPQKCNSDPTLLEPH